MRMVFSVVALLVVAVITLQLVKRQTVALLPAAGPSSGGAQVAPNLPAQVQMDVHKALEQGTLLRASEPAQ